MTDLYLYPTVHHVDVALLTKIPRGPRVSLRAERCLIHRHGQFSKDACPDCNPDRGNGVLVERRKARVREKEGRKQALLTALVEILKIHTPQNAGELSQLIEQRCGVHVFPGRIWEVLRLARTRGLVDFSFATKTRTEESAQ